MAVRSIGARLLNAVRVVLTTAGYAVPVGVGLVRFVQTGTLASATVTLPVSANDGDAVEFDAYAGTVTALSFSPAVAGWTQGAQLSSYSVVRVRWDAADATWHRAG